MSTLIWFGWFDVVWFGGLVRFCLVWVYVLMFGFSEIVFGCKVGINVVQSRASIYRYVS